MNHLKKIGKYLKRFLLFLLGFVLTYALFMGILGIIPVNKNYQSKEKKHKIYLWSNGVHTDIIVPTRTETNTDNYLDWSAFLPAKYFNRGDASYQYIAFGWGEKEFYINTPTMKEVTVSRALKAVFLPTPSAMQVIYYKFPPRMTEDTKLLELDDEQYSALCEHIKSSFQLNENEELTRFPSTYNPNYSYFKAKSTYYFLNTCNNWVGRGLKKAKVRTGVWTPLAWAIWYHL